jgi:hypothetical protein
MGKKMRKRGDKSSREVQTEKTGWSRVSESVPRPGRLLNRLNHTDPLKGKQFCVLLAEKGVRKRTKGQK